MRSGTLRFFSASPSDEPISPVPSMATVFIISLSRSKEKPSWFSQWLETESVTKGGKGNNGEMHRPLQHELIQAARA
jgi:hypothetical protein